MNDDDLVWLVVIGVATAVAIVGGGWVAWWLAAQLSGAPAVPGGPVTAARTLVRGDASWPAAATWWAVGLAAAGGSAVVAVLWRRPSCSVDRSARLLPSEGGLRRYIEGQGPVIGRLVTGTWTGRRPILHMTREDQGVTIAGPRTGKTTRIAIPAAIAHPAAPLVVTSNKRDIGDAITPARARLGRVWTFDPQGLATPRGHAPWVWNPLTSARSVRDAGRLAAVLTGATKPPNATGDSYFGPEGERLLAAMIFTAAMSGLTMLDVYRWITDPDSPQPLQLVTELPGADLVARSLEGYQAMPDRQRAGVYGTARSAINWLVDPDVQAWVTPTPGVEEFDPAGFATGADTLISLSREGHGSAGPLVAALTAAVLEAAERQATALPGGRLERSLLAMLDEAANVCRWKDLPDLYSHYGSRGILIMSIFQSWAQIVEAFGRDGAEKLWSAANVRIYGGGVSDTTFLKRLSDLGGDYDALTRSTSTSRQGGTRSRSTQRRAIYDVAALAAMPEGRAFVLLSAARPVMCQLIPWWQGPHCDLVAIDTTRKVR